MDNQDRLLREALEPSADEVERLAVNALAVALERDGVLRWALVVGLFGFGLGLWLSTRVLPAPPLLIANQGAVFALRDSRGAVRMVSRDVLLDGTVRSGALMFLFHGGVR